MVKTETKKIRVCFVCPKAYPIFNPDVQSVFGGAEVDLYLIATELAKDTHFDVSFIVADYGQPKEETRENVRLLKSLNFKQNPITGALKIWKRLKQADADWYMLETASPGVPLCLLFTGLHRRKLLYRTASERECNGVYLKQHPILGRVFIHSLKKIDSVIVQNQQDQDSLRTRFNIDSLIISNGHRIPDTIQSDKDSILWVGRSAAVKGPGRFVKLAEALPDERFVMICPQATGGTRYDDLKANAAKVKNLRFIEQVPFSKIDGYFEKAKILVNTSDSEGFPNTFVQACKTATAILSFGVNPDGFIDTQHCGLTSGFSEQQMANNLREMLRDNSYIKPGQNGREYVLSRHDIRRITEQYKNIFKG